MYIGCILKKHMYISSLDSYRFLVCIQLDTLDQGQNSPCFIDIITGQLSVNVFVKNPQIIP